MKSIRTFATSTASIPALAALAMAAVTAAQDRVVAGDFTILDHDHGDVLIVDRPDLEPRLGIAVRDGDHGGLMDPATTVLEVGEAARLEVPPGMEAFGPAGSSIWVLPQSQDPALLYVGVSASGLSPALWQSQFTLQLVKVEGPGHFLAWQFDAFSGLAMRMNSRDGIGPDDVLTPILGGHEHLNWGFTAAGLHRVSFKVSGNPMGGTNTVTSAPVTLLFGVVPYSLPAAPAILSAPRWDGTRFTCRVTGSPGRDYQIETSADLRTWTAAASVKTDGAGNGDVDASAQDGARFFRAMALP